MEFCNISTVRAVAHGDKEFPIAIFSPGQGDTRLLYGALARSLASFGYIVITVDHPYETSVVEFPDGTVVHSANLDPRNETVILQQLEVRTADESFLIDQLNNATITDSLFADFPGNFNSKRVAVYGHSLGGATAAITAQRDTRAIGGLNFDGTLWGSVRTQGFDKLFVLVASGANNNSTTPVLEWDEFYRKLTAAKMELAIKNTAHYTFTDVPLLLTVYALPPDVKQRVDQVFGSLDGKKVEKVVDEIMAGLLEFLFNNKVAPLKSVGRDTDIKILLSDLHKLC